MASERLGGDAQIADGGQHANVRMLLFHVLVQQTLEENKSRNCVASTIQGSDLMSAELAHRPLSRPCFATIVI